MRASVDAIIIGKNTIECDNPVLTVRYVKGKNPIRIILDSLGTIKSNSRILQTCKDVPTIIVVSESVSQKNLKRLRNLPLQVLICGKRTINVSKLLNILFKKGIKKILLEGGGTLNWSFIQKNLIDQVVIAITPYILGGKDYVNLVKGIGFKNLYSAKKLKLKKVLRNNSELVLYYNL